MPGETKTVKKYSRRLIPTDMPAGEYQVFTQSTDPPPIYIIVRRIQSDSLIKTFGNLPQDIIRYKEAFLLIQVSPVIGQSTV